ncbi:MAG: HTH domain-containing protein [Myxococcales bacterium]|nr:HTH domain-containing protein [Polyangiaceae bacterium]MDW8248868.1 HTH domain-containing protein [Myxococcales bacterium]
MTFTEAAAEVLRLVGKPLHYKDITEIAIQKNLLSHVGKSPEETMGSRLASMLKKDPKDNPFVRLKPGIFALQAWEESGPPGFAPDNDLPPPYGPGPKKEPSRPQASKVEQRAFRERPSLKPCSDTPSTEELPPEASEVLPGMDVVETASDEAPDDPPAEPVASPALVEDEVARGFGENSLSPDAAPLTTEVASAKESASTREEANQPAEPEALPEEVLTAEEALAAAEESDFHIASPPPTVLLSEEDLSKMDPGASAGSGAFPPEAEVTLPLPPKTTAPLGSVPRSMPRQEERRRDERRRRDRNRDRERDEEALAPAPDEVLRADLVAGAMEIFGEEEDDDQPILGGAPAPEQGGGRRRRRRRRRGGEAGRAEMDPGLPSYTVSPAFGDASASEPREDHFEASEPRREERREEKAPRPEVEGEELVGRDMVELVLHTMGGFERSGGPVPLRNVAESLQRRGKVAGELSQVVAMMSAAIRADNARRTMEGKRPRFRLVGGRLALTDWFLSQELLRLEGEALAAVERYREAARKAIARKLGELPGPSFVELCLTLVERLGVSQLKGVRRPAGGEAAFTGVQRGPGGEVRVALLIRKDAREISRERVVEARGSLHVFAPATAIWMLTSGQVLSGAREEAQALGAAPVALFDGVGLAKLCEEHGMGVLRTMIPLALPDLDFLDALRGS